jgi:NAD-dependent dihydropyrimidine dehydrogenase PreA subunit
MPTITIDKKKCTNCKRCVEVCPVHVFGMENEDVVVKDASKCILCKACEVQCPHKAITVTANKTPEPKQEDKKG